MQSSTDLRLCTPCLSEIETFLSVSFLIDENSEIKTYKSISGHLKANLS